MKRFGDFLTRHRNLFLLTLLLSTLCISSAANQRRLEEAYPASTLPVMSVTGEPVQTVGAYVRERTSIYEQELIALQRLVDQEGLDGLTRQDAAEQLQEIIRNHEAQEAIETALTGSSLAPCAAVVQGGSLTIVTEQPAFTDADAALVMTLADAHAGIAPANVQIITAQ